MADNLHDLFEYKDGDLYWKQTRCGRAVKGRKAGNIDKSGDAPRVRVFVDGKLQETSRIIWEMHNGPIDAGLFVDHIDGDRLNNRLENLRLATPFENACNNKRHRAGMFVGVSFHKRCKKWRAYIKEAGKQISLGFYATQDQAVMARSAYLQQR